MKKVSFFSRSYQGFTLTEVLVSMFVFTIMMTSVSQIFSTTFLGYKNIRAVQRDIDNAQYSLNIIAKELRTSTMTNPTTGTLVNRTDIQFFDHSQNRCLRYRISGGSLQVASAAAADMSACSALTLSSFTTITTGVITGSFRVTPSTASPLRVGKVTLSLDISEGSTHHARIQTSVSLRDFGTIGL